MNIVFVLLSSLMLVSAVEASPGVQPELDEMEWRDEDGATRAPAYEEDVALQETTDAEVELPVTEGDSEQDKQSQLDQADEDAAWREM